MRLDQLPLGEFGTIRELVSDDAFRRSRLLDLGLVPGTLIRPLLAPRSGDPVAYSFRGVVVALRAEDAAMIEVSLGSDGERLETRR